MQTMGTIIPRQLDKVPVDEYSAFGQPIGITPDDSAEIGEVVIGQIVLGAVEALHHIGAVDQQTHNATTQVGDINLYITSMQCVYFKFVHSALTLAGESRIGLEKQLIVLHQGSIHILTAVYVIIGMILLDHHHLG